MRRSIILVIFFSIYMLNGQENRGYIVHTGNIAPNFVIKTLDNEIVNLEEQLGKVIMIQFTASWCSVCIKEMPFIEKEIWQKHKNNDEFLLLALAKDTKRRPQGGQEIELMINKTGITYPIGTDKNSEIFNLFAEEKAGVTRNIIINQNGEIAFLTRLFDRTEFNEMKSIIEDLLKKKH